MNVHRSRQRADRGAVLIIVALFIVALFLFVALVIDLGATRSDRRSGQVAVDNAAASAARTMFSDDPETACEQALSLLALTLDADPFTFTSGSCATFAGTCVDTTPRTATATSGDYTVTLEYPVVDTSPLLARTSTINGAGTPVSAATDGVGCKRFGVKVTTTGDAFFGGIAGSTERTSSVHAVALLNTDPDVKQVAALLILERIACGGLQTSGGGATGSGVVVQKSSATVPGIIAADSAGQRPPCTNNNNANGWVIFGTALPAASGGGPSITAENASASIPGIITTYADAVGGRGGYIAPTGLNVGTSPGAINSRDVADERYNEVNPNITTLHTTAYTATAAPPAPPLPAGTMVLSGNQECTGNLNPARITESSAATTVFVDCSTFAPRASIFPAARNFYVRGNIELKNGDVLALPVVRNLYVRGCSVGGCGGSNDFAVKVANGGSLLVNNGMLTIPAPIDGGTSCAGRESPASGGSNTITTKFATLGGDVDISGFVRLCQTALYVGDNSSAYSKLAVTSLGVSPENYPPITQCSADLPCPKDSAATKSRITFGSTGAADWSAPNQISAAATDADRVYSSHPFEDLALWAETSEASDIRGRGNNSTRGVYFLPNAAFTFSGQGTQTQPLNAQFFVRRLDIKGQGSLYLRPNPNDSITIEVFAGITLIR